MSEAKGADGELLGFEGLLKLVKRVPIDDPGQFCGALLEAVAAFRSHASPDDDVTVLLLHHNAADPPPQSVGQMARSVGKMLGLIKV